MEIATNPTLEEVRQTEMNININETYDDGRLKNGLYCLRAISTTLFGLVFAENYSNLISNDSVKRLFQELVSSEVPPTSISLGEGGVIELRWYPAGKLAINNRDEYIELLTQFQQYLDTVECMELSIDYFEADRSTETEYAPDEKSLPIEFSRETFIYSEGKEIRFSDELRGDYGVWRDSNGNIFFPNDEN